MLWDTSVVRNDDHQKCLSPASAGPQPLAASAQQVPVGIAESGQKPSARKHPSCGSDVAAWPPEELLLQQPDQLQQLQGQQ